MSGSAVTHPIPYDFPPTGLPTVFADGVLNLAISPAVVKFYLVRFEPNVRGTDEYQTQLAGQIVMSVDAFASAAAFFQSQVERLIQKEFLTRERYDELRRMVPQPS